MKISTPTQADLAGRVATVHDAIANEMPPLSHLQCMTCGRRQDLGDVGAKLRSGWPTCCKGYTMRLFTAREVAAGLDRQ